MSGINQQAGSEAEELAMAFLRQKGYKIRHHHWRYRQYELDIVAQDKEILVIVEVKFRGTDAFGYPENAVKSKKQSALRTCTEAYVETYNWNGEVRFDIVAIIQQYDGVQIEHFEDAFYPGL
jgi:putative endonuclease